MVGRIIQGIGIGAGGVFGAGAVVDLFAPEVRAAKLNLWSVAVTCGPALGGLAGGFLVGAKGWRWGLYVNAMINGAQIAGHVVALPETRWMDGAMDVGRKQRMGLFVDWRTGSTGRWKWVEWALFLQSPVVVVLMSIFAVSFRIVSVGLAVTLPETLGPVYGLGERRLAWYSFHILSVLFWEDRGAED